MEIHLRDQNDEMVECWRLFFRREKDFVIHQGDILDPALGPAALVSPGNGFGFMTGGVDAVCASYFGPDIQKKVQNQIQYFCNGPSPVGFVTAVDTGDAYFPTLLYAPTMLVPGPITGTANVFLAFRAILEAAKYREIKKLICPGLGTGIGKMPPRVSAYQMYEAYKNPLRGFSDLGNAFGFHERLCRGIV